MTRWILNTALASIVAPLAILAPADAIAAPPNQPDSGGDIARNAQRMLAEGRQIFRYDSFGDEAFWSDALLLNKAIAGAANGGVGAGVSPKIATYWRPSSLEVN